MVRKSVMKTRLVVVVLVLSVLGCSRPKSSPTPVVVSRPAWEVCFSPHGGCTDLVVRTLDAAQQTVLVQAYSFTSAPIARALLNAKRRGVRVEVILDKSQRTEHYSEVDFLAHAGIPVRIDASHAIAHNKVMILDEDTVITGSFNFTRAAEERNADNLLVLRDAALAARYRENWQRHRAHSAAYEQPASGGASS